MTSEKQNQVAGKETSTGGPEYYHISGVVEEERVEYVSIEENEPRGSRSSSTCLTPVKARVKFQQPLEAKRGSLNSRAPRYPAEACSFC